MKGKIVLNKFKKMSQCLVPDMQTFAFDDDFYAVLDEVIQALETDISLPATTSATITIMKEQA